MFRHLHKLLARFRKPSQDTSTNQELTEAPEISSQKAADQLPELVLKKLTDIVPDYIHSLRIFDSNIPQVVKLEVPSTAAETVWKKLFEEREATGYFPILVGNELRYNVLANDTQETDPSEPSITSAEEFFERHSAELLEDIDDEDFFTLTQPESVPETKDFYVITSTKRPRAVSLLLFPGKHGYEVLNYIPFGGWNACPFDEEHIVVLKYWNEKYGAELATMDADVLELYLDNPITDENTALSVAREQFIYCDDIVGQGTETVGRLARTILHSHIWFFWWD